MNSETREKVRAVFLAAIMALSVVAMSAAFAGSAAAVADDDVLDAEDIDIQDLDPNDVQTVNFTAVAGDDFDDSVSGNPTITISEVGISFADVSLEEADRDGSDVTGAIDVAHDETDGAADADATEVQLAFDESSLAENGEDIEISLDITVEDDSTEVQSAEYTLTSSAGTNQDVGFEITNSENPSVTDGGSPGDIPIEASGLTQDAADGEGTGTGIVVDVESEGQDDVDVYLDVQALADNGVDLDSLGVGTVEVDRGEYTDDFNVDDGDTEVRVNVDTNDGENSFEITTLELTDLDTTDATQDTGLTYGVGTSQSADDATSDGFALVGADGQIDVDVVDFDDNPVDTQSTPDSVTLIEPDGTEQTADADGSGDASFSDLADGTYTVEVDYEGYTDSAQVEIESASTESVELTIGPEITDLDPEEVVVGATENLAGTVDTGEDDTVDVTVSNTSSETIRTGSTSSNFQFTITFDEVGDYEVLVESQADSSLTHTLNVESGYDVSVDFDPEEVQFGEDVTVSGTVTNADGDGVENIDVELEDEGDDVVASAPSAGNGDYSFTTTLNDAGFFNVSTAGSDIVYDTLETTPLDANVTVQAEDDPLENFDNTFTVIVEDEDGNVVELSDDDSGESNTGETDTFDGYVTVVGPFDGDATFDVTSSSNDDTVRVVEDEDENIVLFHAVPDDDGEIVFDATPLGDEVVEEDTGIEFSDGEAVSAALEIEHDDFGSSTALGTESDVSTVAQELEDGDLVFYSGAEETTDDNGFADSRERPDLIGEDSVALEAGDELNIVNIDDVEVEDSEQMFGAEVRGADNALPGDSDELYNATIEVVGPNVDAEIVYDDEETTPQDVGITPSQGGELELTATGFAQTDEGEAGEELEPVTETVEIDGDLFDNLFPTEASVDDEEDIGVTITDTDGEPINVDRNVVFEASENVFNATGVDNANSHLIISSVENQVVITDDRDPDVGDARIADSFTTTTGEYVAENITFEAADDVTLVVEDEGGADVRVFNEEAIDVSGVEAYEVDSDLDEALAGTNDQHNITVTEDGAEVNGTLLDTLADNIEYTQADDDQNVEIVEATQTVDRSGDGTDDTIQVTLRPENATEPLVIDVEDDNDRTGTTSIDVVQPEITTSLGDDAFSHGVRFPDENRGSDTQHARFTSGTGTTTEPSTPACVYYYHVSTRGWPYEQEANEHQHQSERIRKSEGTWN